MVVQVDSFLQLQGIGIAISHKRSHSIIDVSGATPVKVRMDILYCPYSYPVGICAVVIDELHAVL